MQGKFNAQAGPSRLRKPARPFVAERYKPATSDGIFRVVLISSGSVASVRVPNIVGALSRDQGIAVQVVTTKSSAHFYSQRDIDDAVREAQGWRDGEYELGVRVWTDDDEWSDWKKLGDPILHIELRRWADLVVVAPCSADMLAKIAGGICDNLALSLMRALTADTPTIICPAMNTHMYQHALTAKHLKVVQEELGYMVSGPQGAGKLACGDEGPGKMTDWRDIVLAIQEFAALFRHQRGFPSPPHDITTFTPTPHPQASTTAPSRPRTPPTPGMTAADREVMHRFADLSTDELHLSTAGTSATAPPAGKAGTRNLQHRPEEFSKAHWGMLTDANGGDGSFWRKKWWIG